MKNKFLQTSKGLLSRSFDPAKCKTSLRLAGSRLKLLRNKKEVQVNQMKREIAQLLESGKDQSVWMRVEHVIREEKMMSAYDLLEIYCELIVARLPIIESQKNCPVDLKEAIASLVFASPRCGDVPELLDVRKQFSGKYGKDFTTAAIELRPQCGVGRMLVEKLSAAAPDLQTKIKILSAIADEHNIKWESNKIEGISVPPSDSLSGPSKQESQVYAEPPRSEAAHVQISSSNNAMHSSASPLNSSQQDSKTAAGADSSASVETSGVNTTIQPEAKPSALSDEKAQLFQGDNNTSPVDKQRWPMEFKDAAEAAQVAAEAAERASMAAKAAVELSSVGRISRQDSTESYESDVHDLKDEGPETHPSSKFSGERFSESSVKISSIEHVELQNEQIDGNKLHDLKTASELKENGAGGGSSSEEYSRLDSPKSKASADDDFLDHGIPVVDDDSQNKSLKEICEELKKQSIKYEDVTANVGPDKPENLSEERIVKHPSVSPASSHSSISDSVNVFSNSDYQKFENDFCEDSSAGVGKSVIHEEAPQTSFQEYVPVDFDKYDSGTDDRESDKDPFVGFGKSVFHPEASETSFHESAAVDFDKSDSDIDDHDSYKVPTYDEQSLEFHLQLLGQKSPELQSIDADSWSPSRSSSRVEKPTSPLFFTKEKLSPEFPENTTLEDDPELDSFAPVTFDDSDGATSEVDEDMSTVHDKVGDSSDLVHKHKESGKSVRSRAKDKVEQSVGSPVFDSKPLPFPSDDELNESPWKRSQIDVFGADSSDEELKDAGNESGPESEGMLNFGKLTGGLRHKRNNNHLPFRKNRVDVSSSETTPKITRTTIPAPVEIGHNNRNSSKTPPNLESDSDSGSSEEEEEPLRKSSGRKQALNAVNIVKTKPNLGASNPIFGSDDSDADNEPPKVSRTKKNDLPSGKSRKNRVDVSSYETTPKITRTTTPSPVEIGHNNRKSSKTPPILESDSDSDSSEEEEEPLRKSSGRKQALNAVNIVKTKPNLGASNPIFGSDDSDSDNEPPKVSRTKKNDLPSGKSRRTKVSPTSWTSSSYTKTSLTPQAVNSNDADMDKKSKTSDKSEIPEKSSPKPSVPSKSSYWGPPTPYSPNKPTNSSLSEIPSSGKATLTAVQDDKVSHKKSSGIEEPPSPQQKSEASVESESPSKQDGAKKASHVHPKLPDYDTLFESLRANRS